MVNWIGNRVILDLQRELFEHMINFNAAFFSSKRVGAILSYYTVDIRVIGMTVFNLFGRLLLDPCLIAITILALLWLQWKLTILYSLIFPLLVFAVRYFAAKNRKAGRKAQAILARLGAFLQEHFSHIRLVQGYGMQKHQKDKFWEETKGVFSATMGMVKARAASSPINELIGLSAMCGVLLLGGYMIETGKLQAGEFMVYIAWLWSLYQPSKRLERSIQEIQLGLAASERVFAVLEMNASLPEIPHAVEPSQFQSEIRFVNVSFSYDKTNEVLKDINFTARKGELIAFVGPSGAGKTTLVNLIPRLYDPCAGHIEIDGCDLRDMRLSSLRRLIGCVHQDVMIFADSIWVNITCGDERYSREQVIEAARATYADEFIEALPQGYETQVGERGVSLSGGQCQRIAIARAFLRNSPILILDEATSSLDSESERHIKESLERLMEGRTAFVIAHRLSTILHADRIVIIDRGRIIDIGKHDELLQRCDLYRRLYHLQFTGVSNLSNNDPIEPVVDAK